MNHKEMIYNVIILKKKERNLFFKRNRGLNVLCKVIDMNVTRKKFF